MIRTAKILFCDQEHGFGNASFPDLVTSSLTQLEDHFINPPTLKQLRKEAKAAGWTHDRSGHDYCPICTEGDKEDL